MHTFLTLTFFTSIGYTCKKRQSNFFFNVREISMLYACKVITLDTCIDVKTSFFSEKAKKFLGWIQVWIYLKEKQHKLFSILTLTFLHLLASQLFFASMVHVLYHAVQHWVRSHGCDQCTVSD